MLSKQCSVILATIAIFALLAVPGAFAQGTPIAKVSNLGTALVFTPLVEFNELILTVTGPCAFEYHQVVPAGGRPFFELGETTIDGTYRYNLSRNEAIDPSILGSLREARMANDLEAPKKLCRAGLLPGPPDVQSQGFLVANAKIIFDPTSLEGRASNASDFDVLMGDKRLQAPASEQMSRLPDGANAASGVPTKDFVILDDLIVDGSACVGFDCVNGESFGFDTIRLKENNLRIKFDDTSVAASFPRTDWQLTANDSANGGASKFSIDDISGGRTPFTVEANARSNSLYVDDGGRIGSRTSTPSTEIHTIDGDTPTLRLQQDGSSGFAPQTWDVAGNETNFFIRDVTNGSTLPLRVRPGAPTSAIDIAGDGDVGLGTASPAAALHVRRSNGTAALRVEDASTTNGDRELLKLINNGTTRISMDASAAASGNNWRMTSANNGDFTVNAEGLGITQFRIDPTGNVTIPGGAVYNGSDRDKKTRFESVDPIDVLAKVAQIPVSRWSWIHDPTNTRHLGPMAQDFYAAFGLGQDDVTIGTLDVAGVSLAAIQGLTAKLAEKDGQIDQLKARLAALEAMVAALADAKR